MKILADINLSQRVVANLRSAGIDAVRASEVMDPRPADQEIITMATTPIGFQNVLHGYREYVTFIP